MTVAIAGCGWVTPLGNEVEDVWRRLLAGEQAQAELIGSPEIDKTYPVFRVPEGAVRVPPHPRLRRASAISKFAAAAGIAALRNASVEMAPEVAQRTALIFAVSNGGVIYTKRFYRDVLESGAHAASPMLFPETVFNAPASHLAAMLGITGATYTVVADGAVGALAMQMARDLLHNHALDYCLVVGAEEADWLLCDAYHKWRLLRSRPPIEPFGKPPRGMILSEGAGALLLARSDGVVVEHVSARGHFRRRADAPKAISDVLRELCSGDEPSLVVASANGTFIDEAERQALERYCPRAFVHTPKAALGESVGASGMWQLICAAQAIRSGDGSSAVVSICGLNQQVGAVRLARAH